MAGGRVIMGVGGVYHTREVKTSGAPMLDNKANQELFAEQMEVLLKCFNEESWAFTWFARDVMPAFGWAAVAVQNTPRGYTPTG